MAQYIHVEVTRTINAPAEQVYAVLSDNGVGHPAILPSCRSPTSKI